jgi:hypothetical protein
MIENLDAPPFPHGELRDILQFAIWFHDVVYDPIKGAPFNENESVCVWEGFVREAEPCLVRMILLNNNSTLALVRADFW